MDVSEITEVAAALSPEDRALLVDALLRTLEPPDAAIDEKWGRVAERRLDELRSGAVRPVDGREVFDRIWKRFEF